MKKNNFFLAILSLFLVFSCSSEDSDSNSTETAELYGKWVITQLDFESSYLHPECAVGNNTCEFLSNGNLIYDYITGDNCEESGTLNLKYTLEGSNKLIKIRLNGGFNPENDYVEKYTIKTLTETQLVLELYFVDEGLDNGGGIINISQEDRRDEIWERVE